MDFDEMMKQMIKSIGQKSDYSKWQQAGKLNAADLLRMKNLHARAAEIADEIEALTNKAKKIKVESDITSNEWWAHIHKTYGIPRSRCIHIAKGGKILMEPKDDEDDD